MNTFLIYSNNLIVKSLFLVTIASHAHVSFGQEEATTSNTAPDNAEKASEEEPDLKPAAEKPSKVKKVDPAPKEASEKANVVKSSLAKKLDNRVILGTNIGWVSMNSAASKWTVGGAASIFGAWRLSQNADGPLYATGRYTPFAGVLKCDDLFYDATGHGFFGGAYFLIPNLAGQTSLKVGGELGFLKVYAKPQDGSTGDEKARKSGALVGLNTGLDWTFLEKVRFGPFANAYFGGASIIQLGASTTFAF